jgi:hypothetical protein
MTAEKYTIPGGYDFSAGSSDQAAFFAWLAHNAVNPAVIDAGKPTVVTENAGNWSITASLTVGGAGTWPLGTPTAPIVEWLRDEFGVRSAALDDVKYKLGKLADARARAAAAKEEGEELRAEILGILAAQRATVGTVDGQPFIVAKKVPQKGRLDRAGLEREYPEIVERFTGPDSEQTRLEFL